jgi:AcrR family transcriptional regulator
LLLRGKEGIMSKTKETIFKSAIKVFSGRGYTSATMDEIATDAGVAKGTLYYYFKSKEEIFTYIISEGMKIVSTQMKQEIDKKTTTLDKLKIAWQIQINLIYDNRDFFKVILSQMWGKELRHIEIREIIRKYISEIERYVSDAMNSGEIKKGDASFIAYTFFGTLCSTAVYQLLHEDKKNLNELIESLAEYTLKGMQACIN